MMTSKTATWFETKIQYDKTLENGLIKKVTELYVVDALSFTDAESAITEAMKPYISGESMVKAIKRAPFKEALLTNEDNDRFFKAKVQYLIFNEDEKVKRSSEIILVQAENIDVAREYIKRHLANVMMEYETVQIVEAPILEVFYHD